MKPKDLAIPIAIELFIGPIRSIIADQFFQNGKLDVKKLRAQAPVLAHYDERLKDEACFSRLMTKLDFGQQKALLEKWLPTLGANQRTDFIMSVAEMTIVGNATQEQPAIDMLKELADIPDNKRRTVRAAAMHLMKTNEDDYWIVKTLKAAKWTGSQIAAKWSEIVVQMNNLATTLQTFDASTTSTNFETKANNALANAIARFKSRF